MDYSFIDYILVSKSFQHCVKLTNDEDNMAKWFDEFVVSDNSEITTLYHPILCKFLSYLEDAIFDQKSSISFEKSLFDYYCSDDFVNIISPQNGMAMEM